MKRSSVLGTCFYCEQEVKKTNASIRKHILSCPKIINDTKEDKKTFIILIEATYNPDYWLIIKMNPKAKLKDLDNFLRDWWVECCDHLSAFSVERDDLSMKWTADKAFSYSSVIGYDYDFGSTTSLRITHLAEAFDFSIQKKIVIILQNKPTNDKCTDCNKQSNYVCIYCGDSLCKKCCKKHGCSEKYGHELISDEDEDEDEDGEYRYDLFLPIVNSPRCGVCGYDGQNSETIKKYLP